MKLSKPRNASRITPLRSPPKVETLSQLRELQRLMATVLFRPLTAGGQMQPRWVDGRKMASVSGEFIKPNDRLTSFERLEIYNRQYWFRLLDSFYDDYPGLRAVLGERTFRKLAEAYLVEYPSTSFTLRNLGSRLERFLRQEPYWAEKHFELALDVARFEWARIVAFDGEAKPAIDIAELLLNDPCKLRLGLQPHIGLMALSFPVDDFVIAVEKHEALRSGASNAMDAAPKTAKLNKAPLPDPERVFVAVHRFQNVLYYKRLEPEAFVLLNALRRGATLELACERAFRRASRHIDRRGKVEAWFKTWSTLGWFYMKPLPSRLSGR